MNNERIIAQTKKWIIDVVVGCYFCPFAQKEVKRNSIAFEVVNGNKAFVLKALSDAFKKMDAEPAIETMFLVLPQNVDRFTAYLKLAEAAEIQLKKERYSGVYQIATFHPAYVFAGSSDRDPANYTNRSPYPMLQLLREESVSRVTDSYPDTLKIPEVNIAFARAKGLSYMQSLLAACLEI